MKQKKHTVAEKIKALEKAVYQTHLEVEGLMRAVTAIIEAIEETKPKEEKIPKNVEVSFNKDGVAQFYNSKTDTWEIKKEDLSFSRKSIAKFHNYKTDTWEIK